MTTRNDPGDDVWVDLENNLDNLGNLREKGLGDLRDAHGNGRSKLARLLDIAHSLSSTLTDQNQQQLDVVLDLIIDHIPEDEVYVRAAIPTLTRCIVISNLRTSPTPRQLPFPPRHARPVLQYLVRLSTEVIEGRIAYEQTKFLAKPYLSHLDPTDPLVLAFTSPRRILSTSSTYTPYTPISPDAQCLSEHLDDPSIPLSPSIQITSQDLLSIIAPAHLPILRSAPSPPFGIPSTHSQTATGQANAFAGKVYSSHEFRNREAGLPVGLGVGRRGSNHVHQAHSQQQQHHGGGGFAYGHGQNGIHPTGIGMGLGVAMVHPSGGRGDVSGGTMARPASRHVDDYAR